MSDFTNFQLSELMLDMMCAESAIFVLVSERGDIITQTLAAEKLLKQLKLRPIFEILSASAANSLKTALKTGESIKTIESIDSNIYRLDIRPCKYGALLYFMPAEHLFQGLPAHTKYEMSTALSRNLMALNLMKNRKTLDFDLLDSIQKNTMRIQREILHLEMLENNTDLNISMHMSINNLVPLCTNILSECRKLAPNTSFTLESPNELIAVFDKKLITHAVLNLLSNAVKARYVTEITLSLYEKDDMIYIEVSDNGIGIPNECVAEIGSEYVFTQGVNSFMRDLSHNTACGLGLSLVKRISNLHSGFLKAFSGKQGGTSMQIVFPQNLQMPAPRIEQSLEIDRMDILETELSVL